MRNIFLGKSHTKCGREARPRPFKKNETEHVSRSTVCNALKLGLPKCIKTKVLTTCFYLISSFF